VDISLQQGWKSAMVIAVPAAGYAHRNDPEGEEPLVRRDQSYLSNVDRLSNKSHESPQTIVCRVQHCVSAVPEIEG
jgi:hypothetical protein